MDNVRCVVVRLMSVCSPDAIVHRRSNTKQVHPVVGARRVSFHEEVVEPGNGHLIQIRIGDCGERGAPEGQEDPPPPGEPLPKRAVFKVKNDKFPPLYVNRSDLNLNCQHNVLNQIRLEMMKKECHNVWDKHLNLRTNQLINVIKRDLPMNTKESVYKVN